LIAPFGSEFWPIVTLKPKPSVDIHVDRNSRASGMCQSCIEIDKQIESHRNSLRSTTDPAEIERINRLIAQLYRDRVLLHQNPKR
jgi:hypothetical protein